MNLVERTDMDKLRTAQESAQTAATAEDDIQLKAVAYAINSAANTGEHRVLFQEKLRQAVADELEANGYVLKYVGDPDYNPTRRVIISWSSSQSNESTDDNSEDEPVDDNI